MQIDSPDKKALELPSAKLKVADLYLDLSKQVLFAADGTIRSIEPRAWDLLVYFIRFPGMLLSKDDLRREVWDGVVVGDAAISQAVLRIRAVLGDSSSYPKYIETIHRRGYRFIAPITFLNEGLSDLADFEALAQSSIQANVNLRAQTATAVTLEDLARKNLRTRTKEPDHPLPGQRVSDSHSDAEVLPGNKSDPHDEIFQAGTTRSQAREPDKVWTPNKSLGVDETTRTDGAQPDEQQGEQEGEQQRDQHKEPQQREPQQREPQQREPQQKEGQREGQRKTQKEAPGKTPEVAVHANPGELPSYPDLGELPQFSRDGSQRQADVRGMEASQAREVGNTQYDDGPSRERSSGIQFPTGLQNPKYLRETDSAGGSSAGSTQGPTDPAHGDQAPESWTPSTRSTDSPGAADEAAAITESGPTRSLADGANAENKYPGDSSPVWDLKSWSLARRSGGGTDISEGQSQGVRGSMNKLTAVPGASDPSEDKVDGRVDGLPMSRQGPTSSSQNRFRGRKELVDLKAGWSVALAGGSEYLFVKGERGIGKSALVDEFMDWVTGPSQATDLYKVRVACVEEVGPDAAYLPIFRILEQLYLQDQSIVEIGEEHSVGWLQSYFAAAKGTTSDYKFWSNASLFRQAVKGLEQISFRKPLLIIIEDMQWCDEASLALIDYVVQARRLRQFLFLGTYRGDRKKTSVKGIDLVAKRLVARQYCKAISVAPLSRPDVEKTIRVIAPDLQTKPHLVDFVWRWTHGNPLFVRALVDHLKSKVVWAFGEDNPAYLAEAGLPAVLREAAQSTLSELSTLQRLLVDIACIPTDNFSVNSLLYVLNEHTEKAWTQAQADTPLFADHQVRQGAADTPAWIDKSDGKTVWTKNEVEKICDELLQLDVIAVNKEVSRSPGDALETLYGFSNSLFRRIAYENIPRPTRRGYHLSLANYLAARGEIGGAKSLSDVAYHYERGGDAQRATSAHQRAGEIAFRRGGFAEAVKHFQQGLTTWLLNAPSQQRDCGELSLRIKIAFLYTFLGDQYDGEANFQAAMNLALSIDDGLETLQLCCYLYRVAFVEERASEAEPLVARIRHLVSLHTDDVSLLRGDAVLAFHSFLRGEIQSARHYAESSVERFRNLAISADTTDPAPSAEAGPSQWQDSDTPIAGSAQSMELRILGIRAWSVLFSGESADAVFMSEDALNLAVRFGSNQAEAVLLHSHLFICYLGGVPITADLLLRLRETQSSEMADLELVGRIFDKYLAVLNGESVNVLELRRIWQNYACIRVSPLFPIAGIVVAETALLLGEVDLGNEITVEMLTHQKMSGVNWYCPEVMRLQVLFAVLKAASGAVGYTPSQADAGRTRFVNKISGGMSAEAVFLMETLQVSSIDDIPSAAAEAAEKHLTAARTMAIAQGNRCWQQRIENTQQILGIEPK